MLKRFQYNKEFKVVKDKIHYLLDEAQQGKATYVDICHWELCIDKLEVLSDNNINGAKEFLSFTLDMYDKYIKKLK